MVGLEEMETYISRRQNTSAQYISTRPILDLCLEAERRPRLWGPKRWWEQEGLVFAVRQDEGKEDKDGDGDWEEEGRG